MVDLPQIGSSQNNKYATSNEADLQLGSMTQAALSIAMGDADVTLTEAQSVAAFEYRCTGALTADRALVFDADCERVFAVKNETTGGFAITVRYPSGTSVSVSAGSRATIIGDGTGMQGTSAGAVTLDFPIRSNGAQVAAAATALNFVNASSVVDAGGGVVDINVAAAGGTQQIELGGVEQLAAATGVDYDGTAFSVTDNADGTYTLGLAFLDENGFFQSPIGLFNDTALVGDAISIDFSSAFAVTVDSDGAATVDLAPGASGTLGGLTDVDVTGVTDGAVLRYFDTPSPGWIDSSLDFGDLDRCDAIGALGHVLRVVDPGGGAPTRIGFVDPATLPGAAGSGLTVSALGSVTGATTLDADAADLFTLTAGGAVTLTFSTTETGSVFVCRITNGGTNITWPSAVRWPEGAAPTLQAAGVDCIAFTTFDGGTNWNASFTTLGAA